MLGHKSEWFNILLRNAQPFRYQDGIDRSFKASRVLVASRNFANDATFEIKVRGVLLRVKFFSTGTL